MSTYLYNPFISGLAFHRAAKWSLCPRYPMLFEPHKFKENDIVFLNLEFFGHFVEILKKNPPASKFVLITHNSDKLFDDHHYQIIKDVVTKVYAINNVCTNPAVCTIPIGYRDHPYNTMQQLVDTPNHPDKDILLYMNFELNTNMEKRTQCMNHFVNEPYVVKEGFLKKDALPVEEFYLKMARSKYILSPEGTGIDCHRVYESIYLNAIPILKSTRMDDFYRTLPVVVVNDWSEVTESYLNDNYQTLYLKLLNWKLENADWLKASYWLR